MMAITFSLLVYLFNNEIGIERKTVGVISLENRGNGHYHLGCLCIIPAYQGMGIGMQAFQHILTICPDWRQITLVTPTDKEQNIKFYTEKCGFKIGGKETDGNVEVTNFILESKL